MLAAMEIGKLMRDNKLPALVDPSSKCVSACVFNNPCRATAKSLHQITVPLVSHKAGWLTK